MGQKGTAALKIESAPKDIEQKSIDCRHDLHEHPELCKRKERTAALVVECLRSLGMKIKTAFGVTGVKALAYPVLNYMEMN